MFSTSTLPWWQQRNTSWIPAWQLDQVARPVEHYRNGNRHRGKNYLPTFVYGLPPYRYFPTTYPGTNEWEVTPPGPTEHVVPGPREPEPARAGALRLDVEPRESLQIFVDGVFIGTPADLGDEIELTPGIRRIELRAPGYRTLTFDAEIIVDTLITYRGSLEQASRAPDAPAPQAPKAPKAPGSSGPMYLIPGCYMGNVSPKGVSLPAGCDIKKLVTISP